MQNWKSFLLFIRVALFVIILTACTRTAISPPATPLPLPTMTLSTPPISSTSAEPAAGFPAQPVGVPFPTESWPGESKRVRAVVIIYGGKLIYERYSPNKDDGPGKIMPSYSLAKSFTSALVHRPSRCASRRCKLPAGSTHALRAS